MKTRAFTEAPLWKWDILPSLFYRKNTTGWLSSSIENTTCPVEALILQAFLFWSFIWKNHLLREQPLLCNLLHQSSSIWREKYFSNGNASVKALLEKSCYGISGENSSIYSKLFCRKSSIEAFVEMISEISVGGRFSLLEKSSTLILIDLLVLILQRRSFFKVLLETTLHQRNDYEIKSKENRFFFF